MSVPQGARDLNRLRWAVVLLPIAFVWVFEVARFLVLDPLTSGDEGHVAAAMLMGGAIVVFGSVVSLYLDRTQRQLVAQNRDLSATHAVSSAVRGGLTPPEILEQSLDRLVGHLGALAGIATVQPPAGEPPLVVRRPGMLAPGLAWLRPVLDEAADPALERPTLERRTGIDTAVLDLPLVRGGARLGHLRLLFHPPVDPGISDSALADIAGEIAGAVQLAMTVDDLHRRERERAALFGVALQLTGRADLREVLDTITRHARDLLGAERAVACLSDTRAAGPRPQGLHESLAVADDIRMCRVADEKAAAHQPPSPHCPLVERGDPGDWYARPLRGPDGVLGELCIVRRGRPLGAADRSLLGALADMAAIAVRTARLHEAEEQWTIHAERDRIARELHDSLAQVLGVIHLQLRSLETRALDEASHGLAGELSSLADTADEAYRDVREAILGLRETVRGEDGLEGSLREYLRTYSRQTGIAATLQCEGDTRRALSPRAEVQLLRVVQEALTNTRKHAAASRVDVRIDCTDGGTNLVVEDDGAGFDPGTVTGSMDGGFGLASMRERVIGIGGRLDLHTAPSEGTRIVVRLDPEDTVGTPPAEAPRPARR
jgi:two-component system nitrate/nitrite sensor histidine kinase NarX